MFNATVGLWIRSTHRWLPSVALALGLAACGEDGTRPDTGFDVVVEDCTIDLAELLDGGIGRDQIPALTNPPLVDAQHPDAAYIRPFDRVVGFRLGAQVFAVPHNILWWHEIVNLDLPGASLAVTYCPLTGTAMAFDRGALDGAELGVSGLLFRNNLVMFDRSTETLFPQIMGAGVCGARTGLALPRVAVEEMEWESWKMRFPETLVVSRDTRFSRNYQAYPYGDYEREDQPPFLPITYRTVRPPKERVVGIEGPNGSFLAVPFNELWDVGSRVALNVDVGGLPLVVIWDGPSQSGVTYARRLPVGGGESGDLVTLRVENGRIFDEETGSEWNVSGQAVSGDMAGAELALHPKSMVAFWFAWAVFHPSTELWTAQK